MSWMGKLQEERSAETRQRLVDATVDCLFERGYASTTTAEIALRAGLSKGAQIYHFPKKDDLVVAALEYLFAQRLAASREIVKALKGDRKQRLAMIIDTLWPAYAGPTFYAWLELAVASRTDLALREAVRSATEKYSAGILTLWREALEASTGDARRYAQVEQIVNGQMAASALNHMLMGGEGGGAGPTMEFRNILKDIGAFLLER
jgi:AcrR family transcriptional regulator